MSDYMHKEYKLPNGRTVTADFNELGCAMVTIQALDAIFDNFINSADRVEVVRCKDCKHWQDGGFSSYCICDGFTHSDDYCSYGEREDA